MRTAQIAPLHEAVSPGLHGGTEQVVSFLTEELVALSHDVTLFASGDSRTSGTLAPAWPRALRLNPVIRDTAAPHMLMMEQVRRRTGEFDILQCHMDCRPLSLFTRPLGPQARRNRLSSAKACQCRPARQASIDTIMPDPAERMPPNLEDRPGFMGGG